MWQGTRWLKYVNKEHVDCKHKYMASHIWQGWPGGNSEYDRCSVKMHYTLLQFQNASTPFEGLYQAIYRSNGLFTEGNWFYSSMDYIDPDVVVPGGVCKFHFHTFLWIVLATNRINEDPTNSQHLRPLRLAWSHLITVLLPFQKFVCGAEGISY